ncbi:uncharacterized protein LOC126747620 [Anthonomus grandis grandis]|uniref:uncharacterized protein LOC126747620 n=1 Tax=Anthonomus grandis grandis TaxID=2921223 RepID=UPI0021665EC3|nr:uncharacterized protein LOC126747620 [Anthonomus grandis grandis]
MKVVKKSENGLQLYARACAPCRDYYGLTITDSCLILNIWRVSYGPHASPKQKLCPLVDFQHYKPYQEEVRVVFGEGVWHYAMGLSRGEKKLENLPWRPFFHLLSFLRLEDLLKLMRCSKIFYELCNREEVWRLMFVKKFGRSPSKDENLWAIDSCWKTVFQKRLQYVRRALKEAEERKLKKKQALKAAPRRN